MEHFCFVVKMNDSIKDTWKPTNNTRQCLEGLRWLIQVSLIVCLVSQFGDLKTRTFILNSSFDYKSSFFWLLFLPFDYYCSSLRIFKYKKRRKQLKISWHRYKIEIEINENNKKNAMVLEWVRGGGIERIKYSDEKLTESVHTYTHSQPNAIEI